jgi:hypothetical protein
MANASNSGRAKDQLFELFAREERGEGFRSTTVDLDETAALMFVRMRTDPDHFHRRIFDGDWARPNEHPEIGPIRLVRSLVGNDGVIRLVGRQGKYLYATPWIG